MQNRRAESEPKERRTHVLPTFGIMEIRTSGEDRVRRGVSTSVK